MTPAPLVKICGLTREEDVSCAVEAGADLVGFIYVDWSPRYVEPNRARQLRDLVPAYVKAVGVFVDAPVDIVERAIEKLSLDLVQLHGVEPKTMVDRIGSRAIKAFRFPYDGDLYGDTVLLDRKFHSRPTPAELTEHWAVAAAVGEERRVLLAGALDASNVGPAIVAARPWAVDGARGTERTPGTKDHDRVRAFVRAAKEAQDGNG